MAYQIIRSKFNTYEISINFLAGLLVYLINQQAFCFKNDSKKQLITILYNYSIIISVLHRKWKKVLTLTLGNLLCLSQGDDFMGELLSIRNVSQEYGLSVRTLRYYEDIGLLTSIRKSETTARFYEDSQIKKLQQILILRKLNISIKDIKLIFESNEVNTLLSILDVKVNDIDKDIAELNHLKNYINVFLRKLRELTSASQINTQKLLDEINTFEIEIKSEEECMPEVAKGISFPQIIEKVDVRLIYLPACKMVSSGYGNFGEENFDYFDKWFSKFPIELYSMPKDFLWYDPQKNALKWWYILSPEMNTCGLLIDSFEGGIYASAVSRDQDDEDGNRVYQGIIKWISDSQMFELDERPNHYTMSHIITTPEMQKILGYAQLEILVPIRKIKS